MSDLGAEAPREKVQHEPIWSDRSREEGTAPVSDQAAQFHQHHTIGEAIRAYADLHPEHPAIVGSGIAPLSYRQLRGQIDDVRARLRQAGFDRHSRIAVAIANSAEASLAIVAIACSAVAVPLDPKLTIAEVERCFRILRPDAVLVLHDTNSAARTAAEQHAFPIIEASLAKDGTFSLQLALPKTGPALPLDDPDPEAPAFILHTSGTTADPNLVPFSHRNLLAVTKRLQGWFGLTREDRCLNVSPVYYSHALTTTVLPPMLTGGSVAFPADATNVDLSEWLGALKPTWYSTGPTMHLSVLDKAQARFDAKTIHSLRFISSAGAALSTDAHDRLQTVLGVPVLQHYGSSETAQISTNLPPPGASKPGTCGIPPPDTVIIVGEDGGRLPSGERGEILVRGPAVMAGYLNAPELNLSAFVDGWFRTGDIGSLDEEGFLSLHGRQKELINRGSEKINPLEIDHALLRHPEVAQAAAYAVAHPRLGEDVAAAVVLHPGSRVTSIELREFLSEHLATFKIPRRIVIVDQLPRGITGKVQRNRLRQDAPDTSEQPAPAETRLHAALLQLWKKILKTENISIDDDFFEKGGDSLLAMEVNMELRKLTGQPLSASLLFDAPTVRELAKRLAGQTGIMDLFPAPESVFSSFAGSAIANPRKRKLFLSLLNLLGITGYAEKNRQRMIALAERGINPFDVDTVPHNFSGVYPELSVSFLLEKNDGDIAQRAAKLTFAALKYREALLDNSLEKEISGETVIDNRRSHNLFGRVANVRKAGLKWSKEVKDCKSASHIVVAVNGAYYKLDVIDSSGAVMAAGKLLHGISLIMRAAAQDKRALKPYGLLTANTTKPSAEIFHADKLDDSVRIIDQAIFLLALDSVNAPADENQAAQHLHLDNYHNRDYRKSLQIVVLENGFSGATINFFAEIEGVFAARFASWISVHARNLPQLIAETTGYEPCKLEFETIDFDRVPMDEMRAKLRKYSCDVPLIKKIDGIGKQGIKDLNVSPDAFFHAAAHLAYYAKFKRIPSVHNFVDMRGIKFGSITRYLSTTKEMVEFLEKPSKPALLEAFDAHRKAVGAVKSGDYPLHYAYYYLYTSAGIKPVLAITLFKLFVPDILTKHVSPDIWASNIPALDGIYCVGRFGTFFKLARRNCLAGHYMLFPDHIKTCFLSNEVGFIESWQFDQALKGAMLQLRQMLS